MTNKVTLEEAKEMFASEGYDPDDVQELPNGVFICGYIGEMRTEEGLRKAIKNALKIQPQSRAKTFDNKPLEERVYAALEHPELAPYLKKD